MRLPPPPAHNLLIPLSLSLLWSSSLFVTKIAFAAMGPVTLAALHEAIGVFHHRLFAGFSLLVCMVGASSPSTVYFCYKSGWRAPALLFDFS